MRADMKQLYYKSYFDILRYMEYNPIKSMRIKDSVGEYDLILQSCVEKDNLMYFQTVLQSCLTKRNILQTSPVAYWKVAKKEYRETLKNIGKYLDLTPHQVYVLNKRNVF